MNKYIKPLLITLITCHSAVTLASPAQLATAQKIVELTQLESDFNNNIKSLESMYNNQATNIVKNYTKHQELTNTDSQAVAQIVKIFEKNTANISKSIDVKQIGANLYRQNYTEEELQTYKNFLENPNGLSVFKKIPQFSNAFNQVIIQRTSEITRQQNMTQQTTKEIDQVLTHLQKAN